MENIKCNCHTSSLEEAEKIEDGFIYVIKAGEYYKIGISRTPTLRIGALQTANPHIIEVVAIKNVILPNVIEKQIHKILSKHRVHGEWFLFDEKTKEVCLSDVLKWLEGLPTKGQFIVNTIKNHHLPKT